MKLCVANAVAGAIIAMATTAIARCSFLAPIIHGFLVVEGLGSAKTPS